MILHHLEVREPSIAYTAVVPFLVGFHMIVKRSLIAVASVAQLALVRSDAVVTIHVAVEVMFIFEVFVANWANKLRSGRVHVCDVIAQMNHVLATCGALFLTVVLALPIVDSVHNLVPRFVVLRRIRKSPLGRFLSFDLADLVDRVATCPVIVLQTSQSIML